MKRVFFVSLLVLTTASTMEAQSIFDYYHRVSGPETFFADATTQGYTVQSEYIGPVEFIVTGTWKDHSNREDDAFYWFWHGGEPGFQPFPSFKSLFMGFNGYSWGSPYDGHPICEWVFFWDGIGFLSSACGSDELVPYNSSHYYHFVADFGSAQNMRATIGVGDAGVSDNSGGFTITLYQLELGAVPTKESTWGRIKAIFSN